MTEESVASTPREAGPNLPPWALAPGNLVHVYWVNSRLRESESQGFIREYRGDCVTITPSRNGSVEKAEVINTGRIRQVIVILESEKAKDIRRHAWELVKEAAGHINRRSTWNQDGFYSAMGELANLFPDIRKERQDE